MSRSRGGALKVAPVPATFALAAAGAAALLADRLWFAAALVALLGVLLLGARRERRRLYVLAIAGYGLGVFLVWPLLGTAGFHVVWSGPTVPVLGVLDVTTEEIRLAAVYAFRLVGVSLAFAAYALLVDHDRLVAAAGFARRSALAIALATRLVPTLERDAAGFAEALRGRGVAVAGVRGHARLLSPLVAGSLERATNLAESMEARGFGRPGRTTAPSPRWTELDWAAVAGSTALLAGAALWL